MRVIYRVRNETNLGMLAALNAYPRGGFNMNAEQNHPLEHQQQQHSQATDSGDDDPNSSLNDILSKLNWTGSGYNCNKSGFGQHTIILCDQCDKNYHVGCLKKHKIADLKKLPNGKWFYCLDCKRIYSVLQNLLVSGATKLSDSLLDIIRKKQKDKDLKSITDMDVRWRLLSAKESSRKNKLLLSEAVAIFHHELYRPNLDFLKENDDEVADLT